MRNPLTIVDRTLYNNLRATTVSRAEAARRHDQALRHLMQITMQSGDTGIGATTVLNGTVVDRVNETVKAHTEVAAYGDMVDAIDAETKAASLPTASLADQVFAHTRASAASVADMGQFTVKMTPAIRATLFTTAAGAAARETRIPDLALPFPHAPLSTLDAFGPAVMVSAGSARYMQEGAAPTVKSGQAIVSAEGGAVAEATIALAEQTVPLTKFSAMLPVSEEALEDDSMVRSYLDFRLPLLLRQELDGSILTGSGTAPAMKGLIKHIPAANVTTVTKVGSRPGSPLTNILKVHNVALDKGVVRPAHVILNEKTWAEIAVGVDTAGAYKVGFPMSWEQRLFGMAVTTDKALVLGDGKPWCIVGDFIGSAAVALHDNMHIDIGVRATDFAANVMCIRATMRATLLVYNPNGFASGAI